MSLCRSLCLVLLDAVHSQQASCKPRLRRACSHAASCMFSVCSSGHCWRVVSHSPGQAVDNRMPLWPFVKLAALVQLAEVVHWNMNTMLKLSTKLHTS